MIFGAQDYFPPLKYHHRVIVYHKIKKRQLLAFLSPTIIPNLLPTGFVTELSHSTAF